MNQVPHEIATDLIGVIRSQFCSELADKEWFQQRGFFLRIVTWPARWLSTKGVTLPPARYKQILLSILNDVKVHGETQAVKYWPGYLLRVVQQHFAHHEEEIYEEAKSFRAAVERSLQRAGQARAEADPVAAMAQVNFLLRPSRARAQKSSKQQLDLFK